MIRRARGHGVRIGRLMMEMMDRETVGRAEDIDELKNMELWLFQEKIRLENVRRELEASQENFLKERIRMRKELDELNLRMVQERKRLREENLFFEKKMAILQDGFRKLDEDRRSFERQKKALEERTSRGREELGGPVEESVRLLFRGANNPLALRKRYKDLVKIFHPDNLFGDAELAQVINREYLRRRGRED